MTFFFKITSCRKCCFLIGFILIFNLLGSSQEKISPQDDISHLDTFNKFIEFSQYKKETGFKLYLPEKNKFSGELVIFLHGYGGINPFIYGKWIKHLVYNGHIVLYPRYQQTLFSPAPGKFVSNIDTAYVEAINYLSNHEWEINPNPIVVGHSYGGSMSAYLGVNWKDYRIPKPKAVFACEPGTGPFKATKLDSYSEMDEDILLAVVVGEDDKTVGDEMGKNIFSTSSTTLKAYFRQNAFNDSTYSISAGHYEPAANDFDLDNGHKNYTSQKSERVSKIDIVDTRLYWSILDNLITLSNKQILEKEEFDLSMHQIVIHYNSWSDSLEISTPILELGINSKVENTSNSGN